MLILELKLCYTNKQIKIFTNSYKHMQKLKFLLVCVITLIALGLVSYFLGVYDFTNIINALTPSNETEINARISYGRFLEYLELGWVKQVDLYNNSRHAIIQASSPEFGNRLQTIKVQLPIGATPVSYTHLTLPTIA